MTCSYCHVVLIKNYANVIWMNIINSKASFISLFIVISFLGFLLNSQFNNAAERLMNPTRVYEVPVPFNIINYTDNEILLEGDSLKIKFDVINGIAPDSIELIINKPNQNLVIKIPYLNQKYEYNMKNILNPFTYWAEYKSTSILNPWDVITSNKNMVDIIKRPRISTIDFTVIPPKYSGLDEKNYSSNNTDISMLEGSILRINASANKTIYKSWAIVNDEKNSFRVRDSLMMGSLDLTKSSSVTLMCEDENGITNINPPLNKINVLPDYKPQIFVSEPENEFNINEDQLINIDLQVIDDFGFSEGWIEYRIIRPEYLYQDSSVYRDELPGINLNDKAQKVTYSWDISNLGLAPDDEIEFYILVAVILIFITIATGGFMAGTNSGQSFNTFPLMNGKIIPDDYVIDDLGIYNIFENTVAINFNHRWLSIFVFFYILFVCFRFIKFDNKNVSSTLVYLVLFFLTLQVILGIITLLSNVYLPVASLHQTNSILLLSTLLISYHQIKIRKVKDV